MALVAGAFPQRVSRAEAFALRVAPGMIPFREDVQHEWISLGAQVGDDLPFWPRPAPLAAWGDARGRHFPLIAPRQLLFRQGSQIGVEHREGARWTRFEPFS